MTRLSSLSSTLIAARDTLATITPLRKDCGSFCGAACCQPDENDQGGMILFPGEEQFYQRCDWATITESELLIHHQPLYLLTCDGQCKRAERPLACRIFPLTPYIKADRLQIILDVRAWPICPLMPSGVDGLSGEFVLAVQTAMHALWREDAHRAYMVELTRMIDMFKLYFNTRC